MNKSIEQLTYDKQYENIIRTLTNATYEIAVPNAIKKLRNTANTSKNGDIKTLTITYLAAKDALDFYLDKTMDNFTDDEKSKINEELEGQKNYLSSQGKPYEKLEEIMDELNIQRKKVSYQKGYDYILSERESDNLEELVETESYNLINSYRMFLGNNDEDSKNNLDNARGKIDAIIEKYELNKPDKINDSTYTNLQYALVITNTTPIKELK